MLSACQYNPKSGYLAGQKLIYQHRCSINLYPLIDAPSLHSSANRQQCHNPSARPLYRQTGAHPEPTHCTGNPMPNSSHASAIPHRQPASGTAADDSLPDSQQQTRRLPQVEQLLQQPFLAGFIETLSRPLVTQAVRDTLCELRQSEDFRQHGVAPSRLRR